MKILLVEHDAVIAMLAQEGMACYGHIVLGPAYDAQEALRAAAAMPIDIAVVEIGLGNHNDGIPLASELRERFGIPCLLVSSQREVARLHRDAAAAFLPKPYLFSDLERSARCVRLIADGKLPLLAALPPALEIFSHPKFAQQPGSVH